MSQPNQTLYFCFICLLMGAGCDRFVKRSDDSVDNTAVEPHTICICGHIAFYHASQQHFTIIRKFCQGEAPPRNFYPALQWLNRQVPPPPYHQILCIFCNQPWTSHADDPQVASPLATNTVIAPVPPLPTHTSLPPQHPPIVPFTLTTVHPPDGRTNQRRVAHGAASAGGAVPSSMRNSYLSHPSTSSSKKKKNPTLSERTIVLCLLPYPDPNGHYADQSDLGPPDGYPLSSLKIVGLIQRLRDAGLVYEFTTHASNDQNVWDEWNQPFLNHIKEAGYVFTIRAYPLSNEPQPQWCLLSGGVRASSSTQRLWKPTAQTLPPSKFTMQSVIAHANPLAHPIDKEKRTYLFAAPTVGRLTGAITKLLPPSPIIPGTAGRHYCVAKRVMSGFLTANIDEPVSQILCTAQCEPRSPQTNDPVSFEDVNRALGAPMPDARTISSARQVQSANLAPPIPPIIPIAVNPTPAPAPWPAQDHPEPEEPHVGQVRSRSTSADRALPHDRPRMKFRITPPVTVKMGSAKTAATTPIPPTPIPPLFPRYEPDASTRTSKGSLFLIHIDRNLRIPSAISSRPAPFTVQVPDIDAARQAALALFSRLIDPSVSIFDLPDRGAGSGPGPRNDFFSGVIDYIFSTIQPRGWQSANDGLYIPAESPPLTAKDKEAARVLGLASALHIIKLQTGAPALDPCVILVQLYGLDALVGDHQFVGAFHPTIAQTLSLFPSDHKLRLPANDDLNFMCIEAFGLQLTDPSVKSNRSPQDHHHFMRSLYAYAVLGVKLQGGELPPWTPSQQLFWEQHNIKLPSGKRLFDTSLVPPDDIKYILAHLYDNRPTGDFIWNATCFDCRFLERFSECEIDPKYIRRIKHMFQRFLCGSNQGVPDHEMLSLGFITQEQRNQAAQDARHRATLFLTAVTSLSVVVHGDHCNLTVILVPEILRAAGNSAPATSTDATRQRTPNVSQADSQAPSGRRTDPIIVEDGDHAATSIHRGAAPAREPMGTQGDPILIRDSSEATLNAAALDDDAIQTFQSIMGWFTDAYTPQSSSIPLAFQSCFSKAFLPVGPRLIKALSPDIEDPIWDKPNLEGSRATALDAILYYNICHGKGYNHL